MFLDHFYIISVTFIVFRGFGKWNICECSSFATTVTDGKNIFHFFPLKINVNRNKKNNLWSPLVSNFLKASSTCNFHVIFFKLILAFLAHANWIFLTKLSFYFTLFLSISQFFHQSGNHPEEVIQRVKQTNIILFFKVWRIWQFRKMISLRDFMLFTKYPYS